MLFNFDEAMLNIGGTKPKLITRPKFKKPSYEETPDVQHMTIGCSFNAYGVSPPLLIILPKLKKLPPELVKYNSRDVMFASQDKGWMDKKYFTHGLSCLLNGQMIIVQETVHLIYQSHY